MECDPEVLGTNPTSQRSAGSVAVPNGVVTYSGVVLGSVATITCDTGYSVANEYNRTCMMSDGHWSKGTLRCDQETTAGECYIAIQTKAYIFYQLKINITSA